MNDKAFITCTDPPVQLTSSSFPWVLALLYLIVLLPSLKAELKLLNFSQVIKDSLLLAILHLVHLVIICYILFILYVIFF